MIILLFVTVLGGGTLLTYLYEREAALVARCCAGILIGSVLFGLICFALASFFNLSIATIALATAVIAAASLLLLAQASYRARLWRDVAQTRGQVKLLLSLRAERSDYLALALCAALVVLFWCLFRRAVYEAGAGIFTGIDNNYFDLPVHLGIVYGFLDGDNYPPIHPEYAGARLAYPFLIDFLAAVLMRAGLTLTAAFFWQNMIFALAMMGVAYDWARGLTRERFAAILTLVLILLSGGAGWWLFASETAARGARMGTAAALCAMLAHPPHNYTVLWGNGWGELLKFGNSLTTLFLPQRSFLLGLPLFLTVCSLWWRVCEASERDDGSSGGAGQPTHARSSDDMRRMIAAGVIAGLLPLAHAHSFLVLMVIGACLALIFRRWRLWIGFFAAASAIALPQIWWITRSSATRAGSFIEWHFGWMKEEHNFFFFWLINTGLFIPLLLAALLWLGATVTVKRTRTARHHDAASSIAAHRKLLLLFYLPFLLCFIGPNLFRLAPWEFDNIKVFFYWYVASAPLVALLLAHLWRKAGNLKSSFGKTSLRAAFVVMLFLTTLAGGLDVWRAISASQNWQEYDANGLALAALIRAATPPHALILNAPIHNHPVLLSGRRSTLGYPKTVWTHGIEIETRAAEVARIYRGELAAEETLTRLGVDYVVVGPYEREEFPDLNEGFFARYKLRGEAGGSRLYQVR